MAKLFISLYVFITLALLGLSAGLDSFFTPPATPARSHLHQLLAAANKQNIDIQSLLQHTNIAYRLLDNSDIAWPPDNQHQLDSGEAVSVFDPLLGEQIYLLLESGRLLELSLNDAAPDRTSFFLYRTIFFIALGGLVALWIWPLWRDLEALKKSVTTVLPDGNISKNQISSSSLVAPVAIALNSMRDQISALIQSQRELSGGVAHEFRTPLARLKFALGMLDENQDQLLANMRMDVLELEKLVQEMLDFSAGEAHMPNLHFCEIPLKAICLNVVDRLNTSHLAHLSVSVEGNDEQIIGDGHFIERAIENLLLNAARYATQCIVVTIKTNENNLMLLVEDDGMGVSDKLAEKIFEPFFRPDEARDRVQGGAGLGLAIVKRVMQWHQGTCSVSKSALGGAQFTLYFPMKITRN